MRKCFPLLCIAIALQAGQLSSQSESYEYLVNEGIPGPIVFFTETEIQINGPEPRSLESGEKELRQLLKRFSPNLPVHLVCPRDVSAHHLLRWLRLCSEYPEVYPRVYFLPEYDWNRRDNFSRAEKFDISVANPKQ